jgi:hypothetical protein
MPRRASRTPGIGMGNRAAKRWPVLALALVALVLAGCLFGGGTPKPWSETYVPTVVAVIDDAEYVGGSGGRNVRLHLTSGEVLERDLNQMTQLASSNSPADGDLWITGTSDGRPWYYTIPHEGECWVKVDRAQDLGSEVWFSFGLRLPKADGFESPGIPSLNMQGGVKFCVNERGEVVQATLA